MNLAYVGPLPPQKSGVADYGAALLPHLRRHFSRVVAAVASPALHPDPSYLGLDALYQVSEREWWFDEATFPLYQMGNHLEFHRHVYEALCRHPGCVVLHDGSLLPFFNSLTLEQGDRAGWLRELGFEAGRRGLRLGWHALRQGSPLLEEDFPLLMRVIRTSLGVVVHSNFLRAKVQALCPGVPVAVVPMIDTTPADGEELMRSQARLELGLPQKAVVVGTFGYISPSKRLDAILSAVQRLLSRHNSLQLVCVGEVVSGYQFRMKVREMGLEDRVSVTGYVSPSVFQRYLAAVDVGVNLRFPSWGEMSSTVVRLLAAGKPTIVTDIAAFSELPDEVVLKIPYGSEEIPALVRVLDRLLVDDGLRKALACRAREFAHTNCTPQQVATKYASFIFSLISSAPREGAP